MESLAEDHAEVDYVSAQTGSSDDSTGVAAPRSFFRSKSTSGVGARHVDRAAANTRPYAGSHTEAPNRSVSDVKITEIGHVSPTADVQEHVAKLCATTTALLRAHEEKIEQCLEQLGLRQEQALKVQQASLEKSLRMWAVPPKMDKMMFPSSLHGFDDPVRRSHSHRRSQSRPRAASSHSRSEPARKKQDTNPLIQVRSCPGRNSEPSVLVRSGTGGNADDHNDGPAVARVRSAGHWPIAAASNTYNAWKSLRGSFTATRSLRSRSKEQKVTPSQHLKQSTTSLGKTGNQLRLSVHSAKSAGVLSYASGTDMKEVVDVASAVGSPEAAARASKKSCGFMQDAEKVDTKTSGKSGKSSRRASAAQSWCNTNSSDESMKALRRGYSVVSNLSTSNKARFSDKDKRRPSGLRGFTKGITEELWNLELVPEMETPHMRRKKGKFPLLRKFIRNPAFDLTCGGVVIANAVVIGIEADNLMEGSENRFYTAQMCFNAFYVLELGIRGLAENWDFFTSKDWVWNLFDLALLVVVLLEVFEVGTTGSSAVMGRFLRSIRLLRVIRTLRIVRVLRYIREFRKMIFAIAASMQTLFWSLLLLSIIMYMFGVCLTQGVAEWLQSHHEHEPDDDHVRELRRRYGSVGLSMYSLYMSITNGLSWGIVIEPLREVHWLLVVLFLAYISICFFGVLNVVVSVFVESAMHSATHYRELLVQEKMHEKEVYAVHMREVFKQIDIDESGEISLEEMEHFLADEHLRAYLEALEIGLVESRTLFKLLDHDDSGWVDIDEFCEGCLRLKGEAKSFDIHCLRYENHKIMIKWWQFMRYVEARFESLEEYLAPGGNEEDDAENDKKPESEAETGTTGTNIIAGSEMPGESTDPDYFSIQPTASGLASIAPRDSSLSTSRPLTTKSRSTPGLLKDDESIEAELADKTPENPAKREGSFVPARDLW